jgi:proteic killer suppression protein
VHSDLVRAALKRLDILNAAHDLRDLRGYRGNRLEALRGEWQGYLSIRVNDQWRIVFRWIGTDAEDVRLIDYH